MKKLLVVMLALGIVFLSVPLFADITKSQAEGKIGQYVKSIVRTLVSARESSTRDYNKITDFIADHGGELTTSDKAILNGWQADLLEIRNKINDFETKVKVEMPGLLE